MGFSIEVADNKEEFLEYLEVAKEYSLQMIGMIAEGNAKSEILEMKAVKTGRLLNSITWEIDGDDVYIGTNVEYAIHVEFGTVRMKPRPYLKNAVTKGKYLKQYQKVIESTLGKR